LRSTIPSIFLYAAISRYFLDFTVFSRERGAFLFQLEAKSIPSVERWNAA
jgi:hypothetical protein